MRVPAILLVLTTVALADNVAEDRCGAADVEALCRASRATVTAGPNRLHAPTIHANTTYEVTAFTANKPGFLVYEPQVTGEFALYYGAASAKICDEYPACTSEAPSCMRQVTTYVLVEGERYEIELGPIAAGQRALVHLAAPTDEAHVASR